MVDRESNVANAFETTLTSAMGPEALTAAVASTSGAPATPCYLVIDPADVDKREYVYFDGAFTGTSFETSAIGNRYLDGSAAGSGIAHDAGAVVMAVTAAQHLRDLHDRVSQARVTADAHAARHAAGGADAIAHLIPSGGIIMWSGTIVGIPDGWALCDGANGTPDLRDRFVAGAGSTYAVGATGGAASVTLTTAQLPAHTHGSRTHDHEVLTRDGTGFTDRIQGTSAGGASGTAARSQVSGEEHTHNSVGGNTAHENRPPYYALAYIMKL